MGTKVIICPTCGEVLEYSEKAWEAHCEKERRIWIDRAHKSFDAIWKTGIVERGLAYSWLAREIGVPYAEAHFSKFTIEQCKQAISVCELAKAKMLEAFCKTEWKNRNKDIACPSLYGAGKTLVFTGVDRCPRID